MDALLSKIWIGTHMFHVIDIPYFSRRSQWYTGFQLQTKLRIYRKMILKIDVFQMIRQACTVGIKPTVTGRWQSSPYTKDALQILSYVAHSATRYGSC